MVMIVVMKIWMVMIDRLLTVIKIFYCPCGLSVDAIHNINTKKGATRRGA